MPSVRLPAESLRLMSLYPSCSLSRRMQAHAVLWSLMRPLCSTLNLQGVLAFAAQGMSEAMLPCKQKLAYLRKLNSSTTWLTVGNWSLDSSSGQMGFWVSAGFVSLQIASSPSFFIWFLSP